MRSGFCVCCCIVDEFLVSDHKGNHFILDSRIPLATFFHVAPSLPRFGRFAASFPVASLPPFRRFAASFPSLRCLLSVATRGLTPCCQPRFARWHIGSDPCRFLPAASCRLLLPPGYPLGCAELLGATWGLTLLCHRAKRGWQQRVRPRVALRWANHLPCTVANKPPHAAPSLPPFGRFAASFPSLRCLLSVAVLPRFRRYEGSDPMLPSSLRSVAH